VTETGEIYTWGGGESGRLGLGDEEWQFTPRRVEGLNGVKVAAAAICDMWYSHTRGRLGRRRVGLRPPFGHWPRRSGRGFGRAQPRSHTGARPAPPALPVRVRRSPDVLPFRA